LLVGRTPVRENRAPYYLESMNGGIIKFAVLACWVALATSTGLAWGEHTAIRIIQTQTMLIRHKATEEQRRVAENNAKLFFKQLTPAKKEELVKNKVRSVLIRTTRSRETSPAAKEVRMRYSLEGEVLVDDYAYEYPVSLKAGTFARTNSPDPEYVGL
jgi:hypothetical protein